MPYTIPVLSPVAGDDLEEEEEPEPVSQDDGDEGEDDDDEEEEEDETATESEEGGEEDEEYVPVVTTNARVSPNTRLNPARRIVFEEDEQCQEASTSKRIGSQAQEADGVCCPICMESWSSEGKHQVCCLPCGHVYGFSCIEKWIKQCGRHSAKCPQCGRKCKMKDIIKLYVSQIAVVDGEQQKKVLSLQSENEFLKMKVASLHELISQDSEEKMCKEASCLENVHSKETQMLKSEFNMGRGDSQGHMLHGYTSDVGQGFSSCSFALEPEHEVGGADIPMEDPIPVVQSEVAQEARETQTYQRRRRRQDSDTDGPRVDPLAPYLYPLFAGVYPDVEEDASLPGAAYFDPPYMHQHGSSRYERRMLEMASMQLQILNAQSRQLQTGVLFQDYPFGPPPPPPQDDAAP